MSTTDFTPLLIAAFLVAMAFIARRQIKAYHAVPDRPRAYTGPVRPDAEPWYTPVLPYFGQRLDSDERVARAIDHVVYKREDAAGVETPAPMTRKELTRARTEN